LKEGHLFILLGIKQKHLKGALCNMLKYTFF